MIQPPNLNDVMTPEEFAAIRDLHDRRLEEVHEQLRMTSVHDAAMALSLSEDEVRLYLASLRSQPQPEPKPKKSRAGLVIAAVMALGLVACVAVGLLVKKALVSERAFARTQETAAASSGYAPTYPVPMATAPAGTPAPESVAAVAPEGAATMMDAPVARVEPGDAVSAGDAPKASESPASTTPGSPADDGSGYPDAQYEKYSDPATESLPTSPAPQ